MMVNKRKGVKGKEGEFKELRKRNVYRSMNGICDLPQKTMMLLWAIIWSTTRREFRIQGRQFRRQKKKEK